MHPRTPRTTLFPYTTLFRSQDERARLEFTKLKAETEKLEHEITKLKLSSQESARGYRLERLKTIATAVTATVALSDRKSTRLNSSHQIISYAVFCLKKKT